MLTRRSARRFISKGIITSLDNSATTTPIIMMETETIEETNLDAVETHKFLFNKVFSNDLVWDNIASYLLPSDMKATSQTCKLLLDKVRCYRKFSDNMKLIVCRETYKMKITTKTKFKWRCVDIELSTLPAKSLVSVKRILAHVEHLELYEAYGVGEKDMHNFLTEILTNAPNLKSLAIDCTILEKRLQAVFSDPVIQSHLSNLEELKITTGRRDTTRHISGVDGQKGPFPQNILQLSTIPMKLRSFAFEKIDTYYGPQKEHMAYVPQVIDKNCATLTEMCLQLHIWSLDTMKNVICPMLKKLTITACRQNEAIVREFLQNQPLLEYLEVQFKNGFPKAVVDMIKSRSSKLKKLHLKASSFTDSSEPIDWTFLGGLQHIKDFGMFQPRSFLGQNETQGTCSQYLNALPDGVQKIALRGLESGWAGNVTVNTIACLSRFTNLTELSLMRCENALDDDIMQFICLNLTKLRILKFSHCRALTDFGITGRRHDGVNTGISLKNLKGLRELTMRECREITHAGLLLAIQFLELLRLDLAVSPAPVPKESLVQIAIQNTSLESITVNFSIEDVVEDIKAANPRTTRVVYVNEDWAYEDSDSDAEDLDEEFESSDDGSFEWEWDSDIDDDDFFFQYNNYSDYSDQDELF